MIDPFGMSPGNGKKALGHAALDVIGMFPVVGVLADSINCELYIRDGEYAMAAISALAAIPGLGDAVSASKLATKGAKAAELCNIIKKIGYAAKVAENAGEFGINANNAYKDIKEGTVGIGTFASLFAAGLNAFGIYASVKRFNSISVNTGKVTDGVEGVNKAEEKYHIGLGNDLDNYDYYKANKDYESIMSGGSKSKYLVQLDNLSENKINHMINGSKNSNHGWEKLVPDKNWSDIKNIIADVMDTGVEGPYKSVFSKKATINGFEVEVTYTKLSDGTIKISDAWINQ